MRIRKTSQTTTTSAQILNSYSDSQTSGYACDYINGMAPNIITNGSAVKAGFKLDDKDVYVKRYYWSSLPDATIDDINLGVDLSNINIYKIEGHAISNSGNVFPLPYGDFNGSASATIALKINQANNALRIETVNGNFTNGYANANLYFTYKDTTN